MLGTTDRRRGGGGGPRGGRMATKTASRIGTPVGVSVGWDGDVCVLHVEGDLDLAAGDLLRDAVVGAVAAGSGSQIVVDLDEVSFIDCRGMAAVLDAQALARRNGRALSVRNTPGSARRLAGVFPAGWEQLAEADGAAH